MPLKSKSTADVSNLEVTSDAHISNTNVGTSATVTNINPSISTDVPHISATLGATVTTTGATTATDLHPVSISETPRIRNSIHASTGEAVSHDSLKHLDYEHSGHTGFASSEDLKATVAAATGQSGQFSTDALKTLKTNLSTKIERDGKLLSLTAKAGNNWTYTSAIDQDTGAMTILSVDMTTGWYSVQERNPAQDELNAHIQNQDVHVRVQLGEREYWNNKVSAEVDVAKQELILER